MSGQKRLSQVQTALQQLEFSKLPVLTVGCRFWSGKIDDYLIECFDQRELE